MAPYRTPASKPVLPETSPAPREEWGSTAALMLVAAVPLVGFACGSAFSDRELMVGVLGFVLSLTILGRRMARDPVDPQQPSREDPNQKLG